MIDSVPDIMQRAVGLAGALLSLPVLAVLALAIRVDSAGPVIFSSTRIGADGQPFRLHKLRTMTWGAEHSGSAVTVAADPRMTRVGRMLRRLRIDELPQLWNVVKGEMSLVGPRPLILEEDKHIREWGRHRLNLKPGITGLWQVLGRSEIPFEEMIKLDYLYVTGWSISNDIKLILQTLPALLRTRGAY